MPAARYWRAIGLQPYSGAALELSALHLYAGSGGISSDAALQIPGASSGLHSTALIADASSDNRLVSVSAGSPTIDTTTTKFSRAIRIPAGARIATPTDARINVGVSAAGTIDTWIRFNSFTSPRSHLFGVWTDNSGWTIDISGDNGIFFTFNSFGYTLSFGASLSTNQWYFLSFAFRSGQIDVWLDGVFKGTISAQVPPTASTPFVIGSRSDGPLAFDGWIEDFRITSGKLLYAAGASINVPTGPLPAGAGAVTRVDATATLTSPVAPTSGALAALQDNDTATVCRWTDVTAPGFALQWDFGGAHQDVAAVRIGSGTLQNEFLEAVTLQYSSDGATWSSGATLGRFAWPGAAAMADAGATPLARMVRPSGPTPSVQLSGGMAGNAGPVLSPATVGLDLQDAGAYRISNFVEQQGTPNAPVRRRVQLWNQRDSRMVRETWSDATTGAYVFERIRGGDGTRYCAVAYDHTGNYQGVIADNLEPEAM